VTRRASNGLPLRRTTCCGLKNTGRPRASSRESARGSA
jgi:hypothetical protein